MIRKKILEFQLLIQAKIQKKYNHFLSILVVKFPNEIEWVKSKSLLLFLLYYEESFDLESLLVQNKGVKFDRLECKAG